MTQQFRLNRKRRAGVAFWGLVASLAAIFALDASAIAQTPPKSQPSSAAPASPAEPPGNNAAKTAPSKTDPPQPHTANTPVETPKAAALPPPKPPAQDGPAEAVDTPAKQQSTQAGACFPSCRDGYLCHEGQCISACNPPCGAGEICYQGRQCLPPGAIPSYGPPQYMPWPAQPPGGANMPPPPGAFNPAYEQPVAPGARRKRSGPRFFGYLGLQLGLGGGGRLRPYDEDDDRDPYAPLGDPRFDVTSSTGFEGVAEFRLSRYFGVGPGIRIFRFNANNDTGHANNIDLLVVPTLHIPLHAVEIFIPIPLGLSFGSVPDKLPSYAESQVGLTAGLNIGMLAWLSKGLGVYAMFGVQGHGRMLEVGAADYWMSFYRPALTLGLSMRD